MANIDLTPFIEFDIKNFWLESINPVNTDSIFCQNDIHDIQEAYNSIKKDTSATWILNIFLEKNYLLKGEYFINYMQNILLTNRRIFLWYDDLKYVIPLCDLKLYEKIDNGVNIEYIENDVIQKFRLTNVWLKTDSVNNAINKHGKVSLSSEEHTIVSNVKSTLNASYGIVNPIVNKGQTDQFNKPLLYKQPKDHSKLIAVCIVMLFIGGCVYWMNRNSDNIEKNTLTHTGIEYDSITGKKKKKCPWCGGIGRVGYAGESKAQCERTHMGLGNECTTCQGTGYVVDDGQ